MKTTFLTLISVLTFFSGIRSQTIQHSRDQEIIHSIFERIEVQGVNTSQKLLYGYFFYDRDQSKLEKLKNDLVSQSYRFVKMDRKENGELILHVEKVETHTRISLQERQQKLRKLAARHMVSSFDGFDIGNADPSKPLISNEKFREFLLTKKPDALFDLGVRLYNFQINDKAVIVFTECLLQKIKPDTSAYKLGNLLINENKVQDGMDYLLQATQLNPAYVNAFYNLGATCYETRDFHKSIEYYQRADRLKPNDDQIIYGIAASQYAIQQYDKALANCRKALQLNKDNENAKQLLQMLNVMNR